MSHSAVCARLESGLQRSIITAALYGKVLDRNAMVGQTSGFGTNRESVPVLHSELVGWAFESWPTPGPLLHPTPLFSRSYCDPDSAAGLMVGPHLQRMVGIHVNRLAVPPV